jgi:hypothetical protein
MVRDLDELCVVCDQPLRLQAPVVFHPCGHGNHENCDPHGTVEVLCPPCELEALVGELEADG